MNIFLRFYGRLDITTTKCYDCILYKCWNGTDTHHLISNRSVLFIVATQHQICRVLGCTLSTYLRIYPRMVSK